jgi:predicted DCC family thiol-disulfide oxidoreductase YuxK
LRNIDRLFDDKMSLFDAVSARINVHAEVSLEPLGKGFLMPSSQNPNHEILWVLYDDRCGLCQRSKRLGEILDRQKRSRWVGLESGATELLRFHEQLPNPQQRQEGLIVLAPDTGDWRQGVAAIGWLLSVYPWPWAWFGRLLSVPACQRLAIPLYRWISRNRHWLLPPLSED